MLWEMDWRHNVRWTLYLQYKVPVWSKLEVQVLVVQMFSEGQQELILPANVCGQDERAQLLFHILPAEQTNIMKMAALINIVQFVAGQEC